MKINKLFAAAAVLVFVASAMPVSAQKMKTDIPASITTPDSVDTRLGTLKFHDGFPDDPTVQKVYDSLPGTGEEPSCPVYIDGHHVKTLRGTYDELAAEFQRLVDTYVETTYVKKA